MDTRIPAAELCVERIICPTLSAKVCAENCPNGNRKKSDELEKHCGDLNRSR